jgi:hypothetical protein
MRAGGHQRFGLTPPDSGPANVTGRRFEIRQSDRCPILGPRNFLACGGPRVVPKAFCLANAMRLGRQPASFPLGIVVVSFWARLVAVCVLKIVSCAVPLASARTATDEDLAPPRSFTSAFVEAMCRRISSRIGVCNAAHARYGVILGMTPWRYEIGSAIGPAGNGPRSIWLALGEVTSRSNARHERE